MPVPSEGARLDKNRMEQEEKAFFGRRIIFEKFLDGYNILWL
jgi:hypothetical protein